MTILLAGQFDPCEQADWLAALRRALPDESVTCSPLPAERDQVEIAIVANPPPGALSGLPRLQLIQSLWAGVDGLLADSSVPLDVPIARMVDPAMTAAMVETALWAVLALQRDFLQYGRQQREHRWQPHPQRRAAETSVGVLGLGTMGTAVAMRLAAQGLAVRGWSARPRRVPGVETLAGAAALGSVLGSASIVVDLLPATPATRGLFDAAHLAQLPRGAALVNLGRGSHVVEADLLAALASGQLRHAVLDVFACEPLPTDHPFWDHPAVSVLPHVAAQTDVVSAAAIAAANVHRLRAGLPVENLVDRTRGY